LSEVVVVPAPADAAEVAAVVGHAAGTYLAEHVHDGMSIGVGWGMTLNMSLKAIGAKPCSACRSYRCSAA
jgi:DNA-binding transcriptional regulator LsrR (DeoR family)